MELTTKPDQLRHMQSQIIAMGGGGFSMEPDNPLLDRYVLDACPTPSPKITLLPTASGDADRLITQFYTAFNPYDCTPRHVSLFRQPVDMVAQLQTADIVYVTGGNTRNMLAIWDAAGVTPILKEMWQRGIVLAGLSAGAICWFEQGHTDSTGDLTKLDCLGWLPGSCSPHYDGEVHRQPSFEALIASGGILPGIALDDGVAAHYIGNQREHLVSSRPHGRAFAVRSENGVAQSDQLEVTCLGDS